MSGSRRVRQLNEKGLELLERNLRGKCASAIRSANVIANKLSPLLKTADFADFELVRKYGDDFNLCLSEVVRCHEDYCTQFFGDLDTIGEFNTWFQPRFEVLQSLHVYVQQWCDSVQCPSNAQGCTIPDHDESEINPEDSASQVELPFAGGGTNQSQTHAKSRTSRSSSVSSKRSSVKSARILQSLERASLMAEATNLEKRQSLLRKEFELNLEKEALELSTKLAIARAKEEALHDLGSERSTCSVPGASALSPKKSGTILDPTIPDFVPHTTFQDTIHFPTSDLRADECTNSRDHRDRSHASGPELHSKSELLRGPSKSRFESLTTFPDSSRPVKFSSVLTPIDSCGQGKADPADLGAVSTRTVNAFCGMPSGFAGVTGREVKSESVPRSDKLSMVWTPVDSVGRGEAGPPALGAVSTRALNGSCGMHSGATGGTGYLVKPEPVSSYVVSQPTSNVPEVNDLSCRDRTSQFVTHSRDSVHRAPRVVSESTHGGYHTPTVDADLTRGRPCVYVDSHLGDHDHDVPDIGAYDAVDACPMLGPAMDNYVFPGVNSGVAGETEPGIGVILNKLTDAMIDQRNRLPEISIGKFGGDPLSYHAFVRSFDSRIASRTRDYSELFYYLEQHTTGTPKELVRSCLHMPPAASYVEARKLLEQRYGNPFVLAQAYLKKLESWPSIRSDDTRELDEFVTFLISCRNAMTSASCIRELEYPTSLQVIVSKLPVPLQDRWARTADSLIHQQGKHITFSSLVSFVERENRIAMNPLFGKSVRLGSENKGKSNSSTKKKTTTVSATTLKPVAEVKFPGAFLPPCLHCAGQHSLQVCRKFCKILHKDKVSLLMKYRLCFGCLGSGHRKSECSQSATCDKCKGSHPTPLHRDQPTNSSSSAGQSSRSSDQTSATTGGPSGLSSSSGGVGPSAPPATISAISTTQPVAVKMPIIAVKVKLNNSDIAIPTYAFLDSGSSDTLVTEQLISRLGASGKRTAITITTVNCSSVVTPCTAVTGLEVCGFHEDVFVPLPTVYTQHALPVSKEQIPTQDDIACWSYLSGIVIPSLEAEAEIGILIGNNACKATEPWKIVNSEGDGPYAVYTLLGWVINGPLRDTAHPEDSPSVIVNRVQVEPSLEHQMQQYFKQDFSERHVFTTEKALSVEDRRFLEMVDQGTVLHEGHYEICLPLRDPSAPLPNNRPLAVQRLKSLQRKFNSNDVFKKKYTDFIDDLFMKGHASLVPEKDLAREDGLVWYLPHHGVIHPRKNKLRVVLDASARFSGTSLNDCLLSGPDLTNSLIGVLNRFCQDRVALMADLECMFYQVKVPVEQRDLIRFLWWPGGDVRNQVVECRMHTHIFGATSSPAVATYALQKTARDNASDFSAQAVQTVLTSFYVDDCLKSVPSVEEGISLSTELCDLTQRGGFRLTGWISNSPEVIGSIPDSEHSKNLKNVDLNCDTFPSEKALGVLWLVETDQLGFRVSPKDKPATKRGILSTVCSLYDPLGMVAPFVLAGKEILQDSSRLKLGWDDDIPDDLSRRWKRWLQDLPNIDNFTIDRCYRPQDFGTLKSATLHHFSDASQSGYGCVSYLRLVNQEDQVHCAFVFGKARVAPLKQLTIPRMELTAAVVAAKVDSQLRSDLSIALEESMFWTDSTSVLCYIKNEQARFNLFVANRVAAILERSESSQWRYVPSELNPADHASRGLDAESLIVSDLWKKGPQFLWEPKDTWPL